ncbi:hypothetical protein IW140_004882 [Coemansia sp. RSA 1813]|nr:hypothetical protein EV178_002239 [Coemansia sp. RSA 1646]KAJ1770181.1 hypothetical protein LPJ74_003404 [Coemansia sp. RSA 1843]KAJ2089999.1 hypothetical protein IW138_002968 [Coemansia sp. RSA 986]KAJ2217040.1 hypothetical protein EV179_000807 [Coemansia sp. RSA 487]KAJ2566556.1 hypothetical protein IW140_004882 [Coemansia sp. RSA 1813]
MGFCFSKPHVDDDDDNERAALLDEGVVDTESVHSPIVPDRFANLSPEEVARLKEEERLKKLEQNTTDALINISSDRADFMHPQAFGGGVGVGGGSRDYVDILRRFNQQIKLPMVVLSGPGEAAVARGGSHTDIVAILSDPHIPESHVRLVDDTINSIIDITSLTYIESPPGHCIVPLSVDANHH